MFGAPNSSPFTSPTPQTTASPFGSTAAAFGSPAPAFGSTTPAAPSASFGFGSPAPAAFGGTAASTFGGSGFGTPAPAAATGFGGAAGGSTPFGSTAPAGGGLFGAPAPAAAGGLFGAPAPAPAAGGLFGAPTAFGAAKPAASSFGAPAPAASSFGAAPTGGLFGAPAAAPASSFGGAFGAAAAPAFGATAAPSAAFGAAPVPAGGLFNSAPASSQTGTAAPPYQVTNRTDGGSTMMLQAITAMPAHENKSFEELRLEDYTAGNKGTMGQAVAAGGAFGGSAFGAPAASTGFGAAAAPATGGMFGLPAAAAQSSFGAPAAGGLFGAPAPAAAPAFGGASFGAPAAAAPAAGGFSFGATPAAPAPSTGFGFGSTMAPPATTSLFGAPAPAAAIPGGLFGAAAPKPSTGLFGAPAAAPAAGGLFGQPAAAAPSTGLFGAPAPAPAAPGGFFGAAAPAPAAGLFGAASPAAAPSAGLFGAPAPAAAGGLFGAPAPAPVAGGLFGATGGGLFGQPAIAAPAAGMFGAPAAAQPPSTGLFGSPAPTPSMFGAATPTPSYYGASPAPNVAAMAPIAAPTADAFLAQQLAAIENQKKELALLEPWRNSNSHDSKTSPHSLFESETTNNNQNGLNHRVISMPVRSAYPRASTVRIRPRGLGGGGLGRLASPSPKCNPLLSPDAYLGSSTKRLIIQPSTSTPKPKMRLMLTGGGDVNGEEKSPFSDLQERNTPVQIATEHRAVYSPDSNSNSMKRSTPESAAPRPTTPKTATPSRTSPVDPSYEFYQQVIHPSSSSPNPQFPKLTKSGYTLSPSLDTIQNLKSVPNFSISRPNYGSITWDDRVDISNLDLDSIVSISRGEVCVYDEEELSGGKPPVGMRLNRPAVICLEKIVPRRDTVEKRQKYGEKLRKMTEAMGAEFLGYDIAKGEWRFRAMHFSRYGLVDDDDSDDEMEETHEIKTHLVIHEEEMTKNVRFSRFVAPVEESDDDEEEIVKERLVREAEDAYMHMMMRNSVRPDWAKPEVHRKESLLLEEDIMEDEEEEDSFYVLPTPSALKETAHIRRNFRGGICSRIATKLQVSSSMTDYGLRMGRSFRIGFSPNFTFVPPNQQQSPQTLEFPKVHLLPLLETHILHSEKIFMEEEGCHFFSLPKGLGSEGGTVLSYENLCTTLRAYVTSADKILPKTDDPELNLVIARAFQLLLTLYGQETDAFEKNALIAVDESVAITPLGTVLDSTSGNHRAASAKRRKESFASWLRDATKHDLKKDTSSKNGAAHAIFSAVSAGDLQTASSLAMEHEYFRLAAMIVSGGGGDDIRAQIHHWQETGAEEFITPGLMRIYYLLSGDLSLEENTYRLGSSKTKGGLDWRRRMGMKTWCGASECGLAEIVDGFKADVEGGLAPPPLARYLPSQNEKAGPSCVLYRLLRLRAGAGGRDGDSEASLASIVSPDGYTADEQNLSPAFHMAAVVTALGCAPKMNREEEGRLIQAYVTQLICADMWEWAVYITFCTDIDGLKSWQILDIANKAKQILMRHFPTEDVELRQTKRVFLEEKVGVPSSWFDEALSVHSAYKGEHVLTQVHHLVECSKFEEAAAVVETLILPEPLILGGEATTKLIQYLEELKKKGVDKGRSQ